MDTLAGLARPEERADQRTTEANAVVAPIHPKGAGSHRPLRIGFPTERNQSPRLERDIQVKDDARRCELDVCRAAMPFHRAFDHH